MLAQGLENQAYDVNLFVDAWSDLWKRVACLPNFGSDIAGRVFVDVMNEPDSMNIVWEPSGGRPGAHQLYLGTADALWRLTPKQVLFFMEGKLTFHSVSYAFQSLSQGPAALACASPSIHCPGTAACCTSKHWGDRLAGYNKLSYKF